ncbi:Rab9 effector protein [Oopsacas minuta]|uniref:Rab9 effector protein with kelch motifs n=1 Tax=Oopsacas minuta TaxID=111878 RepID=A0AAV7KJI3_9METZ|nr:Rab9 effector protein [Oopsacas minuta]
MAASRVMNSSRMELLNLGPSPIGTRCGSLLHPIEVADQSTLTNMFLIGGANSSETMSDVVSFQIEREGGCLNWEKRECTGDFPGRYEAASFVPSSHPSDIFVFGGGYEEGTYNDLWKLSTRESRWEELEQKGPTPSERTLYSVAHHGDCLYVWGGGRGQTDPVRDTHVYIFDANSLTWEMTPSKGELIQPRQGHAMVYSEGNLLVHAGMQEDTLLDDLFQFDLATSEWREIRSIGLRPEARAAHSAVLVPSSSGAQITGMIIFGGLAIAGALNDFWCLHTKSWVWERIEYLGKPPAPRLDHSMCLCTSSSSVLDLTESSCEDSPPTHSPIASPLQKHISVVVFGGMDTTGTVLKDVFLLKLS